MYHRCCTMLSRNKHNTADNFASKTCEIHKFCIIFIQAQQRLHGTKDMWQISARTVLRTINKILYAHKARTKSQPDRPDRSHTPCLRSSERTSFAFSRKWEYKHLPPVAKAPSYSRGPAGLFDGINLRLFCCLAWLPRPNC